MGAEVFHALKKVLVKRKLSTGVGDEGGFAPDLKSDEEALKVIIEAIEAAGYAPGEQVALALDCAASELFDKGQVHVQEERRRHEGRRRHDRAVRASGSTSIPSCRIEDGLAEDDWEGWAQLTDALGDRVQLVGDDIFVTNTERLGARHRGGRGQRDPHQGEPDRHADRDARGDRDWRGAAATCASSRTAAARPRTPSSPTSPWRTGAGQIKTGSRSRAPTAWRSTTSCCASRRSWASAAEYPGGAIYGL